MNRGAWSKEWQIEKATLAVGGLKRCTVCRSVRPIAEFNANQSAPDGLSTRCKTCVNAHRDKWESDHPDHFRTWKQRNRNHRDRYMQRWRELHTQHRKESYRQWARRNTAKVNALIAKRTAAKLRATPAWVDHAAIEAIYREAARLTRASGIRHEVDHIVPLRSPIVCGLHVPANLQILTSLENKRKRNHHEARFSTPSSNDFTRTIALNRSTDLSLDGSGSSVG